MHDDLPTIPDDALPPCCVRINVGISHAGTGFFVAPGVVVTCNHVVEVKRVSSDEADPPISVVSRDGETYEVLDVRERSPTDEDDIAVLRVAAPADQPCVLLDTGLRARDQLHSFGFPSKYPNGVPTTLEAEGWMEQDRWLKFTAGQIQPGMSGSPVLNLRTGAVCGVLKRTRGAETSLGGYAVSIRCLFTLSRMLESANFRHHTTYREAWLNLLSPRVRRLLLTKRSAATTAAPPLYVLVISVDQVVVDEDEDETAWNVSSTLYTRQDSDNDAVDGSATFEWIPDAPLGPVTVDLNGVRALVARLFRDWASREGTARGRATPGEQIRLLGSIISQGILRGAVGDQFENLINDERLVGEVEHGWMEIAIHFADVEDDDFEEFVHLPWEHLYLPRRKVDGQWKSDIYFARNRKLALVRTLDAKPVIAQVPTGKLSILVVAIKPSLHETPTQEDRAAAEGVDSITNHLKNLGETLHDTMEVKVVNGRADLLEEIEGGYDVVHYVGYGRLAEGADRVALGPDPADPGEGVNGSGFADCLAECMPSLVVLQFCRGGEDVPADLSAFGPPLLIKGCRAVIANQYPVVHDPNKVAYDEKQQKKLNEAEKFNASLYNALVNGVTVEMAAQIARKKVWSGDSESRAFLSPAVFVRNPGGLKLTGSARDTGLRSRVGALPSHA